MKSLLIGSGFISSHLQDYLKQSSHRVEVVHHAQAVNPQTYQKDIDYIFYLAGYGNHYHQRNNLDDTFKANVFDLFVALKLSQAVLYKAFVYVSTSSVTLPTQTMYSGTKAATEKLILGYARQTNKPVISVRPYSVFGEREADFRFIPTVVRSTLRGEKFKLATKPRHDWIYVKDLVRGMVVCAENAEPLRGYWIELGTGNDISNGNVVHNIRQILKKEPKYEQVDSLRDYDSGVWMADTRVAEEIGFKPEYTFSKALRKTVEYYEAIYSRK